MTSLREVRRVLFRIASASLLVSTFPAWSQVSAPARVWMPWSHVGVAAVLGTTGVGVEAATPLSAYINLRGSVTYFGYGRTISSTGYPIHGHLQIGGGTMVLDWFPKAGSFHISPGISLPDLTRARATADIRPRQKITVNGTAYFSDPNDPLHGSGRVNVDRAAPLLTVGWGNLLPRNYHKHLSIPTELGVGYQGPPRASVTISGSVCDSHRCTAASSDHDFMRNVEEVRREINRDLNAYGQFYPILSTGIGYRF